MRTLLMTFLVVLLLAVAAGFLVKDDQGRPYLLAALNLGGGGPLAPGGDDAITVAPEAPGAAPEEKRMLSHLPGVIQRAHEAGEKINEQSDRLRDQLDAASGP